MAAQAYGKITHNNTHMPSPTQPELLPAAGEISSHHTPAWRRLWVELRPRRASGYLLGGLLLTIFLIIYIWWPLAEEYLALVDWNGPWWRYMDWLLINIFAVMSLLIIAGADLRYDARIVFVGLLGGLVIEAWGTQTSLWTYYTNERPPLWIIPAWPVASLAIDRLVRILDVIVPGARRNPLLRGSGATKAISAAAGDYRPLYWLTFGGFFALMLQFTAPTFDRSLTIASLLLVAFLILAPINQRRSLLIFTAGASLGYYLELWGTTRECWTYYTLQTPPLFAVLAHGMAALAFWRAQMVLETLARRLAVHAPRVLRRLISSLLQ
jgi:uncharacterized membrane protein YoaT (DUF817 family)